MNTQKSNTFNKRIDNTLVSDVAMIVKQHGKLVSNIYNYATSKHVTTTTVVKFLGKTAPQLVKSTVANKNGEFHLYTNALGEVIPYIDVDYIEKTLGCSLKDFYLKFIDLIVNICASIPKGNVFSILMDEMLQSRCSEIYDTIDTFMIPTLVENLFKELKIGIVIESISDTPVTYNGATYVLKDNQLHVSNSLISCSRDFDEIKEGVLR